MQRIIKFFVLILCSELVSSYPFPEDYIRPYQPLRPSLQYSNLAHAQNAVSNPAYQDLVGRDSIGQPRHFDDFGAYRSTSSSYERGIPRDIQLTNADYQQNVDSATNSALQELVNRESVAQQRKSYENYLLRNSQQTLAAPVSIQEQLQEQQVAALNEHLANQMLIQNEPKIQHRYTSINPSGTPIHNTVVNEHLASQIRIQNEPQIQHHFSSIDQSETPLLKTVAEERLANQIRIQNEPQMQSRYSAFDQNETPLLNTVAEERLANQIRIQNEAQKQRRYSAFDQNETPLLNTVAEERLANQIRIQNEPQMQPRYSVLDQNGTPLLNTVAEEHVANQIRIQNEAQTQHRYSSLNQNGSPLLNTVPEPYLNSLPVQNQHHQNSFENIRTASPVRPYYPIEQQLPHKTFPSERQWGESPIERQSLYPGPVEIDQNRVPAAASAISETKNPAPSAANYNLWYQQLTNPNSGYNFNNNNMQHLLSRYPSIKDGLSGTKQKKRFLVVHPNGTVEHVDEIEDVRKRHPDYVMFNGGTTAPQETKTPSQSPVSEIASTSEPAPQTLATTPDEPTPNTLPTSVEEVATEAPTIAPTYVVSSSTSDISTTPQPPASPAPLTVPPPPVSEIPSTTASPATTAAPNVVVSANTAASSAAATANIAPPTTAVPTTSVTIPSVVPTTTVSPTVIPTSTATPPTASVTAAASSSASSSTIASTPIPPITNAPPKIGASPVTPAPLTAASDSSANASSNTASSTNVSPTKASSSSSSSSRSSSSGAPSVSSASVSSKSASSTSADGSSVADSVETAGFDLSKVKATGKPAVWFRTTDLDFWDKLVGNEQFNVVYFFQVPPQPKIEKDTKTILYSNGTIVEEITETEWKTVDDKQPKITKTTKIIEPDCDKK